MTKKKVENNEQDLAVEARLEEVQAPKKSYPKKAYSIMQKDGEYHLVCVSFNPSTMDAGNVSIVKSNSDQTEIEYAFDLATENLVYD